MFPLDGCFYILVLINIYPSARDIIKLHGVRMNNGIDIRMWHICIMQILIVIVHPSSISTCAVINADIRMRPSIYPSIHTDKLHSRGYMNEYSGSAFIIIIRAYLWAVGIPYGTSIHPSIRPHGCPDNMFGHPSSSPPYPHTVVLA